LAVGKSWVQSEGTHFCQLQLCRKLQNKFEITKINGNFLQGVPPIEVYRASTENEVSFEHMSEARECTDKRVKGGIS